MCKKNMIAKHMVGLLLLSFTPGFPVKDKPFLILPLPSLHVSDYLIKKVLNHPHATVSVCIISLEIRLVYRNNVYSSKTGNV